jgi:hypothetical protein
MLANKALKLSEDEFMTEVSRVISPKPWEHDLRMLVHGTQYICTRCQSVFSVGDLYPNRVWEPTAVTPCCTPPKLVDPPEVIARRLSNRAGYDALAKSVAEFKWTQLFKETAGLTGGSFGCYVMATPYEQIACCLVALKLWQV